MRLPALAAFLFYSLSLAAAANATTIISTFNTGHSYDCCTGWTISGPSSPIAAVLGGSASVANGFTAPGNYRLSQIDLGLGNLAGANTASVGLWTDSGGLPGSLKGFWMVGGLPPFNSTTTQLTTISGITGVDLDAGANYLLVVSAVAADTWDAWNWNSIGATGLHLIQIDGGDWTSRTDDPLGAFDLIGTAIPEPASVSFLAAALMGWSAMRRKRR